MFNYRSLSLMALLLVFPVFAGCAGGMDSVGSGMSNLVDNAKAGGSEKTGDTAYRQKDYAGAFAAYQKAAEAGGRYGQFMLANMYQFGEGVKRDPQKYLHWMRQSAEKGYPPANYLMGIEYLSSDGAVAAKYFESASQKEYGPAMHMLGLMHARGMGVQQSDKEALRWFRMAKAQGFPVDEQLLSESTIQPYLKTIKTRAPQSPPRAVESPPKAVERKNVEAPSSRSPQNVEEVLDRKQLIRDIQQHLTRLGYKLGTIDGIFGRKTGDAIKAFQLKNGMNPDGLATEKLLETLKNKHQ